MSEPTYYPILFTGEEVRAILDGRKTQTRRVGKIQYLPTIEGFRYGLPGDRLWVRETWKYNDWTEDGVPIIAYRAGGEKICKPDKDVSHIWAELSRPSNFKRQNKACEWRWRPSIFMPRWASRITLEITGVRVERVQDISEADAMAEGIVEFEGPLYGLPEWKPEERQPTAREAFLHLFYGLRKRAQKNKNPWVWVIEFKRLLKGKDNA